MTPTDGTPTKCGVVEAKCECELPPRHEGPHQCACGGSWWYVDGEFRVVSYPLSRPLRQAPRP